MAFNNWPYTNFADLNLDWILRKLFSVEKIATESAASVGQYDERISNNTTAIQNLADRVDTIKGAYRIFVTRELEVSHNAAPATGAEILNAYINGEFPYLQYNGDSYIPELYTSAGDVRFYSIYVPSSGDPYIKRLLIPAQSSNAAYSIKNFGGSGGSSDIFAVTITDRGDYADPEYICDHTFAEITSQVGNGKTPVFLIDLEGSYGYNACGNVVIGDTFVDVYDHISSTVGKWRINTDNTISRYNAVYHFASLDNIIQMVNDGVTTNALLKTAQTLSAAEKAQVKMNLGITDGCSQDVKQALLNCFANVAWINGDGQEYYNALYDALYSPANLESISAVFTQGNEIIYDTDSLDTLKEYLTVIGHYNDSTSVEISNYTLSGNLTPGTSTITVSHGGKTTTFNVTVTSSLVMCDVLTLDGIRNTRSSHNASATTWEDLSAHHYDFAKAENANNAVWADDHAVFDATNRTLTTLNNILSGLTQMTFEFVASVTGNGSTFYQNYRGVIFTGGTASTANIRTQAIDDSAVRQDFRPNGASAVSIISPDLQTPTGTVHHVAFVLDGTTCKTYLDGTLVSADAIGFPLTTISEYYIGSSIASAGAGSFFNGHLYRLGISSTALNAEEIADRYNACKARFHF